MQWMVREESRLLKGMSEHTTGDLIANKMISIQMCGE